MKILHLYHDIMNLYGEYANVSALERMLEKSGVKFTTDRLTLFDNACLLYTSPSPRDYAASRMPSSA